MTKRIVFFFYMSLFFLPSFAGEESYTYSEIKKEPKSPKTDYKIIYDSECNIPVSSFQAEILEFPVRLDYVYRIKGFPDKEKDFTKGISACFAGIFNEHSTLMIGGGCNFPDISAADGGTKKYYRSIYAAEVTEDSLFTWEKIGEFPQDVAYGVTISTPDGILCIGGMNAKKRLNTVYRITLKNKKAVLETLPALPCTLDNMTGSLLGNVVYVAGGNKNGIPCNDLYCLDLDSLSKGWQKLQDFPRSPRIQAVSAAQIGPHGEQIFCLWGGFSTSDGNRQAALSTDGYAYSPSTKKWVSLPDPTNNEGETVSLGGGSIIALSDSLILCTGGVNKDIFLQALKHNAPDYLLHPIEWYRFNNRLLVYNSRQKRWKEIAKVSETARAGASLIFDSYGYLLINGELKPGIRTPDITRILLKTETNSKPINRIIPNKNEY